MIVWYRDLQNALGSVAQENNFCFWLETATLIVRAVAPRALSDLGSKTRLLL